MTKEQLASELNGMIYGEEIPDELIEKAKKSNLVIVYWTPNGYPTWSYRTSIPHATFDIIDEEDVYCKGIVFELADL